VEEIDYRLARYLADQGWGRTSADQESWDAMDSDMQAEFVAFARAFFQQVLNELTRLAEKPTADLLDVARSAEYWLIEIRDQHRTAGNPPEFLHPEDDLPPYDFGLDPL
jgi:hypothetical protein